ncbi:MAG TPA: TonB family protein [Polyangiaceae bacterium]|nr:TonB family protein [Polyangiaceae bacterium]
MLREGKTTIPFALVAFLWASVAIWLHLGLGVGAYEVGVTHDDHKALLTFAERVSTEVDLRQQPTEITFADEHLAAPPIPAPPPEDSAKPPEQKPEAAKPKVEPKKPEVKEQPKPKAPEAVAKVQEKAPAKPTPPLPTAPDKRIAVRQHVQPNQADDPNAHFIGDEANKVKEETVATMTSHDRDDENPSPAKPHNNAEPTPGDSDKTKVAEADEHLGQERRAPGERGMEFDVQKDPRPMSAAAQNPLQGPKAPETPRSGGDGQPRGQEAPLPPELAPGNTAPQSPNVESGDGSWTFNIARAPGSGDAQNTGPGNMSRTLPPTSTDPSKRTYGLGGSPGPGQVNLNLNSHGVVAVVGADQLRREREADGERRRSEHRGAWQASNFDRWRSAIENYVSSVKPGNQTALNTAAVPFATYLNSMHNRIHPIFADSFLASLDALPPSHALNDPHLIARLEIVLTKDGHVAKLGVVKTSGVTAFDIAALDSVQRASPFGPAPAAIVSPDGQVYLHWEFHRDEVYACSTMNARPFMLNTQPHAPENPTNPNPLNPGGGPHERGLPGPGQGSREGSLLLLGRPGSS